MPKLKRLSGDDVIGIFRQHGFIIARQRGSHVTLQRQQPTGERQGLTVPKHRELDTAAHSVPSSVRPVGLSPKLNSALRSTLHEQETTSWVSKESRIISAD
jgi:predicted RNA binding protein YcfA (HicA-like mRNA interferase family)